MEILSWYFVVSPYRSGTPFAFLRRNLKRSCALGKAHLYDAVNTYEYAFLVVFSTPRISGLMVKSDALLIYDGSI